MTGDPGQVACPFCSAGPGQSCEQRATRRPLTHRQYHPARHKAAGVPEPSMDLQKLTGNVRSEPLDMDRVARSWEEADGAAAEMDDPA